MMRRWGGKNESELRNTSNRGTGDDHLFQLVGANRLSIFIPPVFIVFSSSVFNSSLIISLSLCFVIFIVNLPPEDHRDPVISLPLPDRASDLF